MTKTYTPTIAPLPSSEHDGASTTTQAPGTVFISPRPAHLGGGVYIGTRKPHPVLGDQYGAKGTRQYVALDRGAASRLLADLATALAEVEEPYTPRRGDRVRITGTPSGLGERHEYLGEVGTIVAVGANGAADIRPDRRGLQAFWFRADSFEPL